jgi:outer membrane cobalamin receptor
MRSALATLALVPLLACQLPPAAELRSDVRPSHEITAEEIDGSGAKTAWEAVRLLSGNVRFSGGGSDGGPSRASARGRSSIVLDSEPAFVLDGVRLVDIGVLHDLAAAAVDHIRLITGPDATTRWGTNSGHGVILITTRHPESVPPAR